MGNEATCQVEIGKRRGEGKVLLESEELIVRGELRTKFPFRELKSVVATDDVLAFDFNGEHVRLHVGRDAAKWAQKILNPKSVVDKLGVKPGQKVALLGGIDESLARDLTDKCDGSTRLRKDCDAIFFAAEKKDDLAKLAQLRASIVPNGAVWVIHPKGVQVIRDTDVMAAAKEAGLVDVKVVSISKTHTSAKLVIPKNAR